MNQKSKNLWIGIIIILIIIYVFNMLGKNDEIKNTPEYEQCKTSAEKAYKLFNQNNSGNNFPQIDGTSENKKNASATTTYKFNYKNDLSLCFIEYNTDMQATTVDTNEPIYGEMKIVSALVTNVTKQQTLAAFIKTSYPTGSQKIGGCMIQTPGNYDDLNNKPIKDLWNPTKCSSESEFDSIIYNRFGIK